MQGGPRLKTQRGKLRVALGVPTSFFGAIYRKKIKKSQHHTNRFVSLITSTRSSSVSYKYFFKSNCRGGVG